jgi:hypothetical protein
MPDGPVSSGSIIDRLAAYHPIVIEGMGGYDSRPPEAVAETIVAQLQMHWQARPYSKPPLLVIQGDPLEPRGISAITPLVAKTLGIGRGLVCLDTHIADYHAPNADRANVHVECWFSELASALNDRHPGIVAALEAEVDAELSAKNARREADGKPPLKDYYRDFARLQEVTKAACRAISGEITVAHTSAEINDFSVTSFYTVTRRLELISAEEMVPFA